jgi:exopolyphosphatase / guanosine-5'-triphosphate,3'-diphosphate pyrophosphatase
MRLGVLDVGSNTVHHLVVDAGPGEPPLPVFARKWRLRLAEGVKRDGTLSEEAISALEGCFREAMQDAEDSYVDEFFPFATAVLRDAPNRDAVVARLQDRTGVQLTLLSGEDEARFTFAAARRWFGWSVGPMLLMDIGGGSLEIAIGRAEDPSFAVSHPLGAARMSREWLRGNPPPRRARKAAAHHVRSRIQEAVLRVRWEGTPELTVATSKTFEQLARISGAPPNRRGVFLTRELTYADLDRWLPKLAAMTDKQRARLPGVSRHRARQLLAGAIVAHTAMRLLEVSRIRLCPWGLREGIILRRLDASRATIGGLSDFPQRGVPLGHEAVNGEAALRRPASAV